MGFVENSSSKSPVGTTLTSELASGVGDGLGVGVGVGVGVGEALLSTTLTEGVETWEEVSSQRAV